jgi:hypothetical protein
MKAFGLSLTGNEAKWSESGCTSGSTMLFQLVHAKESLISLRKA